MVVTRRAPAAPVPTSRTNSSQGVPRVKPRVPSGATPDVSSPLANGASKTTANNVDVVHSQYDNSLDSASKKGNGKAKGKQKKGGHKSAKRGTSFLELLTRIFLLWFTIYTLSVCPNDESLKSPICRGLYQYRKLVLEPYLLPPLQQALAHPSVAPYVERAKPYVDRTIAVAKPVALRTQSEWNSRVVPQWNKRVVPQWNKVVVPQYRKHVQPHVAELEKKARPYIARLQAEYESKVAPYAHVAAINLHRLQHQARPYIILAAHKTYDGYQHAKPYAIPVLQQIQALLIQFVQFLGEQRRQFVDPHVKKIWERVNELGNGQATPLTQHAQQARETVAASVSKASASVSSAVRSVLKSSSPLVPEPSEAVIGSASPVLPDVVSESESLPAVVPTTNPVATLKEHLPSASSVVSIASSAANEVVSSISSVGSSVTEQVVFAAESVAAAASSVVLDNVVPTLSSAAQESVVSPISAVSSSAASVGDVVSSSLAQASASLVSAVPESVQTASSAIHEGAADIVSSAASALPTVTRASDDDLDLASILADLGLDEDFLNSKTEDGTGSAPSEPIVEEESEEEKAEKARRKKEETAQKRADVTGRHAKWEAELEERIAQNRKALRHSLVTMRKAAATELKESKDIHKEVEDLVEDAEKYLKGAEKYLANLRRESRSPEEKKTIWDRVIEKVDKKFQERLTQTETLVNGWYLRYVESELAEVHRLAAEVKDIAGRAQADVGLDYAWLDDVTYQDWQRYHDLERKGEEFLQQATSIQDGTHPSPPINPVLVAIEDLQNEVQDIVVGFETRLRRIKRNGERAFVGAATEDPDTQESHEDETVSILPIEDDAHKRMEDGESPAVPPVVIGRNREEIISALDRAAEAEAQATSAPGDKSKDPEQVVESLVQEAVADEVLTSASHPPHTEL